MKSTTVTIINLTVAAGFSLAVGLCILLAIGLHMQNKRTADVQRTADAARQVAHSYCAAYNSAAQVSNHLADAYNKELETHHANIPTRADHMRTVSCEF